MKFSYTTVRIPDVIVESEKNKQGRNVVKKVTVEGREVQVTDRFWVSLYARFGIGSNTFKYFSYDEVFERIAREESNDRLRICVQEEDGNGPLAQPVLLGATPTTRPIIDYTMLTDMLNRYGAETINYNNGIVTSVHSPRVGGGTCNILGEAYSPNFSLCTPIDGYGQPNIYLGMIRHACDNQIMALGKVFRSQLSVGSGNDDVLPSITRALDGFSNDEGYAALRQRIEAAGKSWASVYESGVLYKMLIKLHANKHIVSESISYQKTPLISEMMMRDESVLGRDNVEALGSTIRSRIISAFHRMTGDVTILYGLANVDALSTKRQRLLPCRCTATDLINFATEVSTHYADNTGANALSAWVGDFLTADYDLEQTKEKFEDFADFHVDTKLSQQLTGSEHAA